VICCCGGYHAMVNNAIKQLRKQAGLTQEEVAKRARTPRAYISQIENGLRSPSHRMAEDILMKGIGLTYSQAKKITDQWKLQKVGLPQELQPIAETEFVTIPILCSIPCGEPEEVYDETDGYISMPGSKIPKNHRIFAVTADGLSMLGENIAPGDIIICDPDAKVKDGDMAIVKVEDGFTLKRVRFRKGYVILEPANKGFKPIETSKLEIVAKVIYIIKQC
ncbi:LexA family protein, partial [Candidatus Poribacteria bacterium]